MPNRSRALRTVGLCALLAAACLARGAFGAAEKQVSPDPGRSKPVHRIPLFDAEGDKIDPTDKDAAPLSLRVTCNKCHDYEKIATGWHFSGFDPNVLPGRPGEPWVLADPATGTQIPVAPRGWPGTYRPADIGLSSWQFVDKFGRHLPGGGIAEEKLATRFSEPTTDRWEATGYLEINCLGCHHDDFRQNGDEWAKQVTRGNYVEAATAASGFGRASGYVNMLPSTFDRMLGEAPDNPQFVPAVQYDPTRFDAKHEVFVNVTAEAPPDRCYYCHSHHPVGDEEWQAPRDVHMARGLSCTACHRNGLAHRISRNYETDPATAPGRTCRGCHLGEEGAGGPSVAGFGAAPRPAHRGLPKLHLDELACTACHAGPYPTTTARRVQTARIHALGFHGIPYDPNALPAVLEPVFAKGADGKIAPHRAVFPAFFGRMTKDGKVTPLLPQAVVLATGDLLKPPPGKKPTAPTAEKIAAALKALGEDDAGAAVYVGGGRLHRLDASGKLTASDHPAAAPYLWPIGHDVRPAAQALGADGRCTDCHAGDSAFLFGKVPAVGPVALGEPAELTMNSLEGLDATFHTLFGLTFIFRPWLKVLGFASSIIVLLIFLAYGCPPVAALAKRFSRRTASHD